MTRQPKTYHHGDLRAALLDEAAAMIAEGGAESVTMRGLGHRAGVSRTAAYRHFEDKTALLVAVAAAGFKRLGARVRAIETDDPHPSVERFRRLGEAYVRFAIENPAYYRLMYGSEALTRLDYPELRASGNALFEQLVALIGELQDSGAVKRDDPRALAYVAWSAVHGLASLLIEGQIMTPVDVDVLIRQTTQTVLDGMRATP